MYNGKEAGKVLTNHSLTVEEIIRVLGYDVKSPKDCETAYKRGFLPAYIDDNGEYCIDVESCGVDF